MRKFLFVGLGGSGGKTLRFLRRALKQWLRSHDLPEDLPDGWQFLHIDSPTDQDGQELRIPMLPPSEYLGLVGSGVTYEALDTAVRGLSPDMWEVLSTWRVNPAHVSVPINVGAGQFRSVGRTIALAHGRAIHDRLNSASSRLMSASAQGQLEELYRQVHGTSPAPTTGNPIVIIVSSLAGGTGAGLLFDVCDLLWDLGEWGRQSVGVLYASDVFQNLDDANRKGVQPNSLAALCELLNGHWLNRDYARSTSNLQAAGMPLAVARSGPAFPFIVGRKNSAGVAFGTDVQVFEMVGEALANWTTDVTVQAELLQYTIANWSNAAAGNQGSKDLLTRGFDPPLNALGFARVDLGTLRLERYASERLARAAVVWAAEAHVRTARGLNRRDKRQPLDIAQEQAGQEKVGFLTRAGLNEIGPDNNQIVDAIQDFNHDELFLEYRELIHQRAVAQVPQATTGQWVERIRDQVGAVVDEYRERYDESLRKGAGRWVRKVQTDVMAETTHAVSRYGLLVTSELLVLAMKELRDAAAELSAEAHSLRQHADDWVSEIQAQLPQSGKIPATNVAVGEAVRYGLYSRGWYANEAKRFEIAQALVHDLVDGFLRPLQMALANADARLTNELANGDGVAPPVVEEWPEEAVPSSLQPPPNEFMVIPWQEFPALFAKLLDESAEGVAADDKQIAARIDVLGGEFLGRLDPDRREPSPPLLKLEKSWVPDPKLLLGQPVPRQSARFSVAASPTEVLARAREWLRRPNTGFERMLRSDLRSFTGNDEDGHIPPLEMERRQQAFMLAFKSSIRASKPLASLDPAMLAMIYAVQDASDQASPSMLPFRAHPLEDQVSETIHGLMGERADQLLNELLSTDAGVKQVFVSSNLGPPYSPLVFASADGPDHRGLAAGGSPSAGHRLVLEGTAGSSPRPVRARAAGGHPGDGPGVADRGAPRPGRPRPGAVDGAGADRRPWRRHRAALPVPERRREGDLRPPARGARVAGRLHGRGHPHEAARSAATVHRAP